MDSCLGSHSQLMEQTKTFSPSLIHMKSSDQSLSFGHTVSVCTHTSQATVFLEADVKNIYLMINIHPCIYFQVL